MNRKKIKTELLIHDLKNPLAVVQAGIDGLISRRDIYGALTEKQEKVLLRLMRNIRASRLMVNDALELARADEGIVQKSVVSFGQVVGQVLTDLFDLIDTGISDRLRYCEGPDSIRELVAPAGLFLCFDKRIWQRSYMLDEAKTVQILRNLLSNAFKYKKSRVDFSAEAQRKFIRFTIKDDGQGIPKQYQQQIFESYFQIVPKEYGTVRGHGIGLAGVLTLLNELGGELRLVSESGQGAEFIALIPV